MMYTYGKFNSRENSPPRNTSSLADCSNSSTVKFMVALVNVKQLSSEDVIQETFPTSIARSSPIEKFALNMQSTQVSWIFTSLSPLIMF